MITTAGSGGLEAAVVNTLSPGDKVLGVSIGSFGDRFAKIARIYGADVTKLDAEWGYAAAADEVREQLRADARRQGRAADPQRDLDRGDEPDPRARRGRPRRGARRADPRRQRLGTRAPCPFEMDAWGVDVVVTGSQKAWMSAPGLAMIAASPRAWTAMETRDDAALLPRPPGAPREPRRRSDAVHPGDRGRLPGRRGPAADGRGGRRPRSSPATRRAPPRHGPAWPPSASSSSPTAAVASRTVTAALVPDDLDWKAFNGEVKRRGVVLAGGQGKLTGKIFRLGHLGSVTVEEILGAMSTLEFASLATGRAGPTRACRSPPRRPRPSRPYGLAAPAPAGAGA